jgi:hypothetical protein
MRTQWNEAEDDALHGLPWIAQLVYLRALRPYMDYATGTVGMKRGVSLKSIAEMLHVEHGQGRRDYGDPTPKAVRYALELLEREGLIERIAADRQLVFHLPLADTDSSVSDKWGRRGADVGQTKQGRPESSADAGQQEKQGRRGADHDRAKWGTPPVSDMPEEEDGAKAPLCGAAQKSRFGEFWDAWPTGQRKRDRHKAMQAWQRHRLDALADMIITDVTRRATDDQQWLRGYAPLPTTYLNGRRWEDEFAAPTPHRATVDGKAALTERNRSVLDSWLNHDAPPTADIIEGVFNRESS